MVLSDNNEFESSRVELTEDPQVKVGFFMLRNGGAEYLGFPESPFEGIAFFYNYWFDSILEGILKPSTSSSSPV